MEEQAKMLAELLKVLANENRLLILCALMEKPQTVGRLLEKTPYIGQSAMSQHLALMKAHGILKSQKSGQSITYSIADHRIEAVIGIL
ncbi:MAG: ArsR/SmtB family transcription factor, partial [Intestinibacillus sp.]